MFGDVYRGKRVLVTGHSGFKGSWLCCWLRELGAEVCGVSLPPDSSPNHYELLNGHGHDLSHWCDVRDAKTLNNIIAPFDPELIFHLAAQPLVRKSYREPAVTFTTNVTGTVNLLEIARTLPGLRGVVVVTSDKCYRNTEKPAGYTEDDPLGGFDPYSASKACQEIAARSYADSFFHASKYSREHHVLIATARAGNVIGGGDWGEDRLVPDLVKAAAAGRTETIRAPQAVRPWQHVLEPLSGYLDLGRRLYEGVVECADAWNFGPKGTANIAVKEAAEELRAHWPAIRFNCGSMANQPHETGLLCLDSAKARRHLCWSNVWDSEQTFAATARWYRKFYESGEVRTRDDLAEYLRDAARKGLPWTR